jgi:hypothetical protein
VLKLPLDSLPLRLLAIVAEDQDLQEAINDYFSAGHEGWVDWNFMQSDHHFYAGFPNLAECDYFLALTLLYATAWELGYF